MALDRETLKQDLKVWITQELGLRRAPADIKDDAPLFGKGSEGLGIDSLDALQLGAAAEVKWGVKVPLDEDRAASARVLASVDSLADFILAHGK